MRLILASTSAYRRALLARLGLAFDVLGPCVDEAALAGEGPEERAARLAQAKAQAVGLRHPEAWVIGSDQVAHCERRILDKPGDAERTRAQLRHCSGKAVHFHTAVCLYRGADGRALHAIDHTIVHFRRLDAAQITRYVEIERPFDCAGGFKAEGLGICLFEAIENSDPTAIIGLPLIALCRLLNSTGYRLP